MRFLSYDKTTASQSQSPCSLPVGTGVDWGVEAFASVFTNL